MKLLIVLIVLLNCSTSFAQKHRKSKKNELAFTYSYRMEARDFKRYFMYGIEVHEWNADSVIINCSPDSTKVWGTISYDYNLVSGITDSNDGRFQIKMSKKEFENVAMTLTIQFEGYDETVLQLAFDGFPDEFFVFIDANSIFDEETPYVIINSVYPLTVSEQKALINCMSMNKSDKPSCYDEKLIRLIIPI